MTSKTEAASQVRQILESVRAQMTKPGSHAVNEAMTRAHFLNPLLGALGYAAIDDILFEHYLPNGKTFLDYRLVVGGKPRVAVEAKALQSTLDDKDAAQVVSYATVLGDEWAVVTNAREWRLYHVFAHAPLEGKLLLTIDLVGWQNDAQFDGVFEQLWLISKDSFEGGDGPASWVASKKLDQLIRAALTDASSSEVKYLRGKLEQKGVAVSAEQIASWLKARLDADTPVAPSPTHVSYPLAADATKASPTHEGSIPYAVGPPLTPEPTSGSSQQESSRGTRRPST